MGGIDSAEGRSSPRFVMPPRPKEEPETIRKWREEQEMRLKEKDEAEQVKMNKTKVVNRESEKEFVADINDIRPGTEWERVNKLVDFNTKTSKNTKDMSRMRSIMLQLKQTPPVKSSV